ncbi:MAG: HD-GYP domain-containing protein, partial [Ruminiclostridium sp.]|nr:HD-GYP domain-containing protein [Ruminiclostridium sp.]
DGVTFSMREIEISGETYSVLSGDTLNYIMFFISLATICTAMYHGRLKEARKTYKLRTAAASLERKNKEAHELFVQTAEALASAIDAKDPYTNGHSVRVAEYSRRIAEDAGKTADECENIYYTALLHDVGKIGVRKSILSKPGRLTDEEFEQIKQHTVMGSQILSNISRIPWLSIGAHYHHERYNGRGYPEGLKGEEIPDIARIIAVADAYDAMTSNRSYRNAIPQHIVREELAKGTGIQFDPDYARIMIHMIDADSEYRMKESITGANVATTDGLRCDSLYHDCTEGINITKRKTMIRLCSQPYDDFPENESLPSLIVFDSLDGKVHPGDENNKYLLYFEYARIRLDGQLTKGGVRKAELRICEGGTDIEQPGLGDTISGQKYKIEAVRNRDHMLLHVSNELRMFDVILALPDTARYTFVSLGGEHCEIHNIMVNNEEFETSPDSIPRIAEEISYIKDCPQGDIPNIEIDGPRFEATLGIPVKDGLTLSFHSVSYPTARLVWHCPYICVFSARGGHVKGADFREYLLLKMTGENWESQEQVENVVNVEQTKDFPGWNAWLEMNKQGLDYTISINREKNVITLSAENAGVVINSTTTILDGNDDIYVALTGDQCAITNIRTQKL